MVGVFASVNLPLHHKVQKFSSGTSSPSWSRKKGRKTDVVVLPQPVVWPRLFFVHEYTPEERFVAVFMPFSSANTLL